MFVGGIDVLCKAPSCVQCHKAFAMGVTSTVKAADAGHRQSRKTKPNKSKTQKDKTTLPSKEENITMELSHHWTEEKMPEPLQQPFRKLYIWFLPKTNALFTRRRIYPANGIERIAELLRIDWAWNYSPKGVINFCENSWTRGRGFNLQYYKFTRGTSWTIRSIVNRAWKNLCG